jgi:predicted ATPase
LGIEQPDLNLHPQLIRNFAEFLKKASGKKQIFITTHSTVFLDSINSKDILIASKHDGATDYNIIHEDENLKPLLLELIQTH